MGFPHQDGRFLRHKKALLGSAGPGLGKFGMGWHPAHVAVAWLRLLPVGGVSRRRRPLCGPRALLWSPVSPGFPPFVWGREGLPGFGLAWGRGRLVLGPVQEALQVGCSPRSIVMRFWRCSRVSVWSLPSTLAML